MIIASILSPLSKSWTSDILAYVRVRYYNVMRDSIYEHLQGKNLVG